MLAAAGAPQLVQVPPLAGTPVTVAGLEELAAHLFAPPSPRAQATGGS
jgi:hypothetical protein